MATVLMTEYQREAGDDATPEEVAARRRAEVERADRETFRLLTAPFDKGEIRSLAKGGRTMSYVTARTVRRRLNEVLGPWNWWVEIEPGPTWVRCRLSIRIASGVLWKDGIGGYPKMPEADDSAKGGGSDALKVAAFQFGIGEQLYGEKTADYSALDECDAVEVLQWEAEPAQARRPDQARPQQRSGPQQQLPAPAAEPPPGRVMFDWARSKNLVADLTRFGRDAGFPERILDWSREDCEEAALAFRARNRGK
jgi:hypothetical protein